MQAPFTRFPQPVVCSICNMQYKDVHEHIEHMTNVHQMKASFRCSTCGEIFPSKNAVETHLATHAGTGNHTTNDVPSMAINLTSNNGNTTTILDNSKRTNSNNNNGRPSSASSKEGDKPSSSGSILSNIQVTRSACDAENVLALDIEEDEEEDGDDVLLKDVFSCSCGKAYFLRNSFEAHQKVCPNKKSQYSSNHTITSSAALASSTFTRNQDSDNHATSDLIASRRPHGRGRSLGNLDILDSGLIGSEASKFRQMIEAIHSDGDTKCKACTKPMKGFISLCNHLSGRKNSCRELYNNNWIPCNGFQEDISTTPVVFNDRNRKDRSNNSSAKSIDSILNTKRASHNTNASGAPSTPSSATVGSSGASGSASDSKEAIGYSPAFTDLGPDDIIIAPADELIRRAYLVRNRVQCPRCTKIFGGKTPAVAYNNHRRNKHCPATQATVPYLKAKFNKNKNQSSPQAADVVPMNSAVNPVTPQESESKLADAQAQVRYYCKLCPNRDIKNRVSLGVHLTTYHGLPPVNISSTDGIALRCQTCSQTFNSKYFYNMHRYECDLTSPYIGILEADKSETEDLKTTSTSDSKHAINERDEEMDSHLPAPPPSIMPPPIQSISPPPASSAAQQQSSSSSPSSVNSSPSTINSQSPKVQPTFSNPPRGSAVSNAYFGSNYTCTLCHKKGFPGPNAVRIHQKYQCVKRPLVPPPKSPYPSPLAKPRSKSYSRPSPRDESQSGSNESRLAALLGSPNPTALDSPSKGDRHNQLNRVHESGLLMCDNCGRGPYNSQYYLLEHKRQYCQVGKTTRNNVLSPSNSSSSKSIDIESALEPIPKNTPSKSKDLSLRIVPSSSSSNNLTRPVPPKTNHTNDICLIIGDEMVTNGSYVNESNAKSITNNGTRSKHKSITKNKKDSHGDIEMTPENVPPRETAKLIECLQCGFTEIDLNKFVRHRLTHFSDKPEDSTTLACYNCEICKGKMIIGPLSRVRQHLHQHVKIHNSLFKKDQPKEKRKRSYPFDNESDNEDDSMITCPYCRACRFSDASGLSQHIKNDCPFRFRCIKCDRTFDSKNSLDDHKETCLEVNLRNNSSKTLISCHHCGLKFTSKQRLFYHEQACHKVYNVDVSQRVEELIERASTCAICGLRAKNYIVKAKHEVKCLEMALDSLGIKFLHFENVEDIGSESSIVNGESVDRSSLISANGEPVDDDDMEIVEEEEDPEDELCELMEKLTEEELEDSLRRKFGIDKECSVVLERLKIDTLQEEEEEEEDENEDNNEEKREIELENLEDDDEEEEGEYDEYDEDCDNQDGHRSKLDFLKSIFEKLLRVLVSDEKIYKEIINGKTIDVALRDILQKLGADPPKDTNNRFRYINNFRSNIETFLQLSIEKETLEKASTKTTRVDEVINNLLNIN